MVTNMGRENKQYEERGELFFKMMFERLLQMGLQKEIIAIR